MIAAGAAWVVRVTEPSVGVEKRPELRSSVFCGDGDHMRLVAFTAEVGAGLDDFSRFSLLIHIEDLTPLDVCSEPLSDSS